ncbi:hypothetical protein B0H10DRAFT_1996654 [Mycena sp. CBHHK59/15]|nr:hypothetical protein B0H10DRAFT_2068501 [Mycena sp. CBHHK59/15]KAJ6626807.1 hypothetical protein B0H10DRAFT_1996654 [Mycena sp. CBHHK59/15]
MTTGRVRLRNRFPATLTKPSLTTKIYVQPKCTVPPTSRLQVPAPLRQPQTHSSAPPAHDLASPLPRSSPAHSALPPQKRVNPLRSTRGVTSPRMLHHVW